MCIRGLSQARGSLTDVKAQLAHNGVPRSGPRLGRLVADTISLVPQSNAPRYLGDLYHLLDQAILPDRSAEANLGERHRGRRCQRRHGHSTPAVWAYAER